MYDLDRIAGGAAELAVQRESVFCQIKFKFLEAVRR